MIFIKASLKGCLFIIQDLTEQLKSEVSGNFESVIVALMEEARAYDAKHLRMAMMVKIGNVNF